MNNNQFKQTWWDKNLNNSIDQFKAWTGTYDAESKVKIRQHVVSKKYKSIADFGCGLATEYFGYKKDNYDIEYIGIDSCNILYEKNISQQVPMILAEASSTSLIDNSYDVSFARHLYEHQPTYKPFLNEMIRVASKEVIHIFFIKPKKEIIHYDPVENLYHNTFDKQEIEHYCYNNTKVKKVYWIDINKDECSLHIELKDKNENNNIS